MGVYAFCSELNGLMALLPSSGIGADIGAGTGIFAKCLSSEERTVICLDPSPKMLEKAAERNLMAVLANAEDIPLRYGSMDFAYMVTVIEFLPDPLEALRSIGSVIRLGAPLVIVFINRESAWGELYSKLAEGKDPIFSRARLYTLVEIRHALQETGYLQMETIGTLTAPPDEPTEEYKLVSVRQGVGVILIKASKRRPRRH
jgi:ubiquinone/menaquinone biosynthesis C-methylase UbiE